MGNPFATSTELFVLGLLRDESRGAYGLQIVKASAGRLSRGTVYVILGRLESKGYVRASIVARPRHPGLPRPNYVLTGTGLRVLEAAEVMGLNPMGA
jgi:DNA-binding PadR family transcriptional regulator